MTKVPRTEPKAEKSRSKRQQRWGIKCEAKRKVGSPGKAVPAERNGPRQEKAGKENEKRATETGRNRGGQNQKVVRGKGTKNSNEKERAVRVGHRSEKLRALRGRRRARADGESKRVRSPIGPTTGKKRKKN